MVITIIVLLILAGVTIATLTGDKGVLTKAETSKEETRGGTVEERKNLWKTEGEADEYADNKSQSLEQLLDELEEENLITSEERAKIENTGHVVIGSRDIIFKRAPLPKTDQTIPYYPDEYCKYVEGDLEEGLVIADKQGNEYVWIEVPKSITKDADTKDALYNVLNEYSGDYKDPWSSIKKETNSDVWYEGCGLSEQEYNENYITMLNSIKENGGFYIGRYKMGSYNPRNNDSGKTKSGIKINLYPYNYLRIAEAQDICEEYKLGDRKSSLMYDIQYNLACKFLEVKEKSGLTKPDIAENSERWGNYMEHDMKLDRGKYMINDENGQWLEYTENSEAVENKVKKYYQEAITTEGASEENRVLNIYDFTGNTFTFTLGNYACEKPTRYNIPYIIRGGYFDDNGSYMAASWNSWGDSDEASIDIGFRNCIY